MEILYIPQLKRLLESQTLTIHSADSYLCKERILKSKFYLDDKAHTVSGFTGALWLLCLLVGVPLKRSGVISSYFKTLKCSLIDRYSLSHVMGGCVYVCVCVCVCVLVCAWVFMGFYVCVCVCALLTHRCVCVGGS